MSTPAEVARKVRQLDNDVQSIYEMLARIEATQGRQGNRLGELASSVAELDGKVGDMSGKIAEMDGKLDRIIGLLEQR
jgi:hypothetical protein